MSPVTWNDLTKDEQANLEMLGKGSHPMLTTPMAERLKELGLAEQKLGGTGISRAGQEMLLRRR